MPDTIVPSDLRAHAVGVRYITGLQGGDVGVAPDVSHKRGGGYHCGCLDIVALGEYPDGDYSTRQQRDRIGGNVACAVDVGADWPNGGRAAWLRYNNELVRRLEAGDRRLSSLRAVNYTPDGSTRLRYDTLHPEQGSIPSTDTVTVHTHEEHWRDTEGTRARAVTLAFQRAIMRWAIDGTPISEPHDDEDDAMGFIINPDETNVPVRGGAGRGRYALQLTNDTGFGKPHGGAPYALRLYAKPYGAGWVPITRAACLAGGEGVQADGLVKVDNGATLSWSLPDDTRTVSIVRMALDELDKIVPPLEDGQTGTPRVVYGGALAGTLEPLQ